MAICMEWQLEKGIYGVKNGKRNRVERSIQCHAPTFYSILFRRERISVFLSVSTKIGRLGVSGLPLRIYSSNNLGNTCNTERPSLRPNAHVQTHVQKLETPAAIILPQRTPLACVSRIRSHTDKKRPPPYFRILVCGAIRIQKGCH
jgi:hypothetical protein